MANTSLLEKLKSHIEWEDGMDETMLPGYLSAATNYVKNATGGTSEQLVLMVAAILNDFRVPEKDMIGALDSLTPFFVQEVYNRGTIDESPQVASNAAETSTDDPG